MLLLGPQNLKILLILFLYLLLSKQASQTGNIIYL